MEPLFLDSPMHEKIWGGNRLKTEFGYDISSEHTANTGQSLLILMVYPMSKMESMLVFIWQSFTRINQNFFGNPKTSVFPLLTKILDANDWLSVQVHPDDAYGLEHEGELGKTECWYIIDAEEGAEIIYGHNAKTKEELASLIEAGDWDGLLSKTPVKKGDFFFVPSGTMHAIGPGILILETQQSSDTTYRVYDFDRRDDQGNKRELHIQQSLDVLNLGDPENSVPATVKTLQLESTCLTSNSFFAVYKWKLNGLVDFKQSAPYLLCSVLSGNGTMTIDSRIYCLKKW